MVATSLRAMEEERIEEVCKDMCWFSSLASEGPSLVSWPRRMFYVAIALMLSTCCMAPWASCEDGFPFWSYIVAVGFSVQCGWANYSLVQELAAHDHWATSIEKLSRSWCISRNLYMTMFVIGPLDRFDFFADTASVFQQMYCSASVDDIWGAMWRASFLAPIMASMKLWMVQAALLTLATAVQWYFVARSGTRVKNVRVECERWVERVTFDYHGCGPPLLSGRRREEGFALADSEHIVGVRCTVQGARLCSIQFQLDSGRSSPSYGGGEPQRPKEPHELPLLAHRFRTFQWHAPAGYHIVGLGVRDVGYEQLALDEIRCMPVPPSPLRQVRRGGGLGHRVLAGTGVDPCVRRLPEALPLEVGDLLASLLGDIVADMLDRGRIPDELRLNGHLGAPEVGAGLEHLHHERRV
eukprot:CAMPEP_0176048092 /NCGR_PEP_ID=MMETSP0120_2-20121206/23887_1 /TAXON_ID=160619 /ORGANISM="Kryptoperidinium foliaceum, Strain CCMP 1326" /LENGTH=410 /DNA_ID=CAMNT_0017381507 /DNA_START=22 /DNA_END=1254 /DNA_ORIENTATION=+